MKPPSPMVGTCCKDRVKLRRKALEKMANVWGTLDL